MQASWGEFKAALSECTRCGLHKGRTHVVPGEGDVHARLMFIGEGPGRDEDLQGRPFVGASGQLLTRMIQAMELTREAVYIANIVKCRPPGNRNPLPEEIAACLPYLRMQFALVRPQIIVLLGSVALQALLGAEYRITRCRGQWIQKKGVWIMPTYHPAALLHDVGKKRDVWADLQQVMQRLRQLQDA